MQFRRPTECRRWAAWILLIALHVALAWWFLSDRSPGTPAARTGFPLDDTWIHLVYGRSVAHGGLPCYNDGELEAGFTSPAWVGVCAVAHWLAAWTTLDVVIALKALTVLSAISMSLGVFELTRVLTGGVLSALLAGLLCALAPTLAFSQVSGMEVCLSAAFSLWAVYALHRERPMTAGLLLAAAAWSRPELLLLVVITAAACLMIWRESVLTTRRGAVVKLVIPTLIAVALWSAYCLAATGKPLPNTYYGKFSAGDSAGIVMIVREIVWPLPANFIGAGPILALLGVVCIARTGGVARWVVLVFPWCFFVAVAMSRGMPEGKGIYFYWFRYALPAVPFLFVLVGVGWSHLWGSADRAAGRPPGFVVRRAVAAVLAALTLVTHSKPLQTQRERLAWNCQNMNEVQVALGGWVAANTPAGATVVVNDAGAIRYFGNRRTIDLIGLNNHALAHDVDRRRRIYSSPQEMRRFMTEHDAKYLIVFPTWFPGVFGDPEASRVFHVEFQAVSENYTVAPAGQDRMYVFSVW